MSTGNRTSINNSELTAEIVLWNRMHRLGKVKIDAGFSKVDDRLTKIEIRLGKIEKFVATENADFDPLKKRPVLRRAVIQK